MWFSDLTTLCRDYRAMPALDRYDDRDIDDEVVGETFEAREEARLRAEREMDRAQGVRRTRLPAALLEGVYAHSRLTQTSTRMPSALHCTQFGLYRHTLQLPALARLLDQCMHYNAPAVRVAYAESAMLAADDVDEEDRRPTQRRRLEEAQAGGFDENMEPLVSCYSMNTTIMYQTLACASLLPWLTNISPILCVYVCVCVSLPAQRSMPYLE